MPGARPLLRTLHACLLFALPLLALAIPPDVPLRTLAHQSWSLEAGLPQSSANDIAFDRDGFVWIGTENGLARFDGNQFQVFHERDVPALKSSFVTRLYRDRGGRLWIGTIKNLAYHEASGFQSVSIDRSGGGTEATGTRAGDEAAPADVGRVNGFAEDAGGDLYVAADAGLFRFRSDRLQPVPGWSDRATAAAVSEHAVWIAGSGRVSRFSDGQQHDLPLPARFATAVVTSLSWSDNALWLGTSRGLLRLRGEQFDVQTLEPGGTEPNIQSVSGDGDAGLWVGTDKMLYRLDRGRMIDRIPARTPGVVPWPMTMKTGPDDLWIGSETDGLQHFWMSGNHRIGIEHGLIDPIVWSYAQDGERLFVGTNSGVAVIEGNKARPFIPREALPYPVAYSLLRAAEGRLWVGTFAGLARFTADGRIDRTLPELDSISINGLAQDDAGTIWAATSSGLFRIDGDAVQALGADTGLPDKGARYVLHTRRGGFWVGFEDGLYRRNDDRFEAVKPKELDGAFITSLLELDDERLVAGTIDRGLFLLDAQGWRQFSLAQGLPSNSVYFLGATKRHLIVAGEGGAYRIALDALGHPAGHATGEGLPLDNLVSNPGEHQGNSRLRCCNGGGNGKGILIGNELWLPTIDGALRMNTDTPSLPPPVAHIVGLDQNGVPLTPGAAITVAGPSRDVAIRYGAIDYRQTSPLQFRYRLNGFDAQWIEAGDRRTAFYTNLPPGRFTLEVTARRAFEAWGPLATVTLDVPRKFTETWISRLLYIVVALLLIALIIRSRVSHVNAQKLALEAIVAERTRELEQANQSLREMSVTDPLTGLHNRRFLEQTLPMLLAKITRHRAETGRDLVIGVLVVDIDHFKRINDQYGHGVGDAVLQRAASAMRTSVRDGEFLLRWGGEEFLAVIDVVERTHLVDIARRLHKAIANSCTNWEATPGTAFAGITCSIGYAALPITPTTPTPVWSDAIQLADYALYSAKAAGRNRYVTIDPETLPPESWRNGMDGDGR